MQKSEEIIAEKRFRKDSILNYKKLLLDVVCSELGGIDEIHHIHRADEGGGATLFTVLNQGKKYFLKVKEKTVFVESKLEEEKEFLFISAIQHEATMLERASEIGVQVPKIKFFKRVHQFDFLAMEYINETLIDTLEKSSISEIMKLWEQLECEVRKLYKNGIVHSDLHEGNIRCRDKRIYIIDFEESRNLSQYVDFKNSLDFIGKNEKSTLGIHSCYFEQEYKTPFNCLARLKEVFNKYLALKLFEYVKECNYDSNNGIVCSLDHGNSNKTYQKIRNRYFVIAGQRNEDERSKIVNIIVKNMINEDFDFVDIGSNNGQFCRDISLNNQNVKRCVGLEGFYKFNILARGLAFLENIENVEYIDFYCGSDSLLDVGIEEGSVFSVCSVWHHITNKMYFLDEIKVLRPKLLIFELATQDGIYNGKSWKKELEDIKKHLNYNASTILTKSKDYNRPIILVTKEEIEEETICRINQEIRELNLENANRIKDDKFERYINGDNNLRDCCICFGTGEYAKKAYELFKENILFFIDNKEQHEFMGFQVLRPREASQIINKHNKEPKIIISTSEKYHEEIKMQLNELGLNNYSTLQEVITNGLRFVEK